VGFCRMVGEDKGSFGWTQKGLGTAITRIRLDVKYRHWSFHTRLVLLHELVHAELPATLQHGPRFEKRMRELAAKGAFTSLW
jgi:hypothetical protein